MSGETMPGRWSWAYVEFIRASDKGGTNVHFVSGKHIWSPKAFEVLNNEWDEAGE